MLEAPKQLGAQITANPAVLTDILAEEDRVKVNTSPNYEDDKMNVMLISGNFDGRKVLATPNLSKKTSYAGIAKKVRRSETFDPVGEVDDVLAVVPVVPSPVLPNGQATPSPACSTVGALRAQLAEARATSRLLQLEQEASSSTTNKKKSRAVLMVPCFCSNTSELFQFCLLLNLLSNIT